MMESQHQDDDTLDREATRWRVLLSSDEVTLQDRLAFDAWLQADPRHARRYQAVDDVWQTLPLMTHLREHAYPQQSAGSDPELSIAQQSIVKQLIAQQPIAQQPTAEQPIAQQPTARPPVAERPSRSRVTTMMFHPRRWAVGFAMAASLVLALIIAWPILSPVNPDATHYSSRVGEIRDITLSDQSQITLSANTTVKVTFSDSERQVELKSGAAFFAVSKDPNRPFYVTTQTSRIRVVGTKFDVHHGPSELRVSVQEGIVEVRRTKIPEPGASDAPATTQLTAGEQLLAPHQSPAVSVRAIDPDDAGAWRSGRLIYHNTSLREIIADVNRYSPRRVSLIDQGLGELAVTGSYRTDRIEQMIAGLTKILPIEVRHFGEDIVIVAATPSPPEKI